jgi:pimeloyl-ACP methyl ester carboxylesterase
VPLGVKLAERPLAEAKPSPFFGEHNAFVLSERLGLSSAEIEELEPRARTHRVARSVDRRRGRPFCVDPALDMYDPRNGPPYASEFLERYRAAQVARNRRITERCREQLAELAQRGTPASNLGFVLHRTFAEPGFVDLTIEPTDRAPCRLRGDPAAANLNASSLGRYSSLHSWLSQFSVDDARANALVQLQRASVPVLVVQGTADECVLPHHPDGMFAAVPHDDKQLVWVEGGTHYLFSNDQALRQTVDSISGWLTAHGLDERVRRSAAISGPPPPDRASSCASARRGGDDGRRGDRQRRRSRRAGRLWR